MLSPQLILSGIIFLSPQHPSFFKSKQSDLWISDSSKVKAQTLNGGVMLSTALKEGLVFAQGLLSSSLQRIQIVSPNNYRALDRCPQQTKVIDGEGLYISEEQILNPKAREQLSKCGFDDLRIKIKKDAIPLDILNEFTGKELALTAHGIRIRKSSWENGKKTLLIDESPIPLIQIKEMMDQLSPYYNIKTQKTPSPGNTLIIEITLFEFFRSAAETLGINWPEQLKIFSLADAFDLKSLNKDSSLGFNFGKMQGLSKILAKPRLRVQAGEKASFQSGGELPIKIITETVQKTQWKPYGLILDLKLAEGTKAGDQEVSLAFKMELSEPQLSQGTSDAPAMQTRKLESNFDLRLNETTLLSSMTQQRSGQNKSGVNGLMDIPLAGHLFSKKGSQHQSTELWFAIRPTWEDMPYTREMREQANGTKKF